VNSHCHWKFIFLFDAIGKVTLQYRQNKRCLFTLLISVEFSSERPEYFSPFATQWTGSAEDKDVSATPSVRTVDSRCSGFRPIVITHFNTNVPTSRDLFQWIETTWLANRLLPPHVILQITFSSVKLCRSLSAVDWSVLYGIWFYFYHWMYFTLSNVFAVTSILLCYIRLFYVIMTGIAQVLQSKQAFCFKLERYSVVKDSSIEHKYPQHRDSYDQTPPPILYLFRIFLAIPHHTSTN
jgi:hypothetical protein